MLRKRAAVAAITAALASTILSLGQAGAAVSNPTVEGPVTRGIHGRPWFSSLVNLADYGYIEEEFLFSGPSGADTYKSRMAVRRPVDPARFSGTVYVEWVNVTGGRDLETLWPAGHPTILAEGHAYVVVSAQLVVLTELRAWDPLRYGTLSHPGDSPGSFHVFEQAIQSIRSPVGVDPLGGLDVEYVIASGDSQSAGRLTSYITGGYAIAGHIDGFVPGRGGGNAATGQVAAQLGVPMLWILEESQGERPADTEWQKFWYQAGAAHAPLDWEHYVWRSDMRDLGFAAPIADGVNAACSMNRGEGYTVRSAVHWINRWVRGLNEPGSENFVPPTSPRLQRDAEGELVRDADGHAIGGIRFPYIDAPIALNTSEGCPLFGSYEPFSSEEIIARYPTKQAYVSQVTAVADAALAQGFLLPTDRVRIIAEAQAFDVWSPGTALCHDLRGPIERADYDSTYQPCPPAA